jgi:hypothetical protein
MKADFGAPQINIHEIIITINGNGGIVLMYK